MLSIPLRKPHLLAPLLTCFPTLVLLRPKPPAYAYDQEDVAKTAGAIELV